jgi:hypothetical protein
MWVDKILSVVCAVAMGLTGGPSWAGPPVPVRKSGQWELKTISGATGTIVTRVCITPADNIIVPSNRGTCSVPKVEQAGDQTIVNTICKTDEGEERISTLLTGDFTTWYRAIVKMTFDPPGNGPPNLGVTIEGRYMGEGC